MNKAKLLSSAAITIPTITHVVLDHGAKGDGRDDSLAFKSAIRTGLTVVVPSGLFNVCPDIMRLDGLIIKGQAGI